jgi:hypothetical protein
VTEVTSVKDSFRLSGRREDSQREVKELDIEFRKEGISTAVSGVWLILFGTGIVGDVVVCSNDVSKSTGGGLNQCE